MIRVCVWHVTIILKSFKTRLVVDLWMLHRGFVLAKHQRGWRRGSFRVMGLGKHGTCTAIQWWTYGEPHMNALRELMSIQVIWGWSSLCISTKWSPKHVWIGKKNLNHTKWQRFCWLHRFGLQLRPDVTLKTTTSRRTDGVEICRAATQLGRWKNRGQVQVPMCCSFSMGVWSRVIKGCFLCCQMLPTHEYRRIDFKEERPRPPERIRRLAQSTSGVVQSADSVGSSFAKVGQCSHSTMKFMKFMKVSNKIWIGMDFAVGLICLLGYHEKCCFFGWWWFDSLPYLATPTTQVECWCCIEGQLWIRWWNSHIVRIRSEYQMEASS